MHALFSQQDIKELLFISEQKLYIMGKMPTSVLADVEVTCFFLDGPDDEFLWCEDEFESVALQLSVLLLFDHWIFVIIRFVLGYFKEG